MIEHIAITALREEIEEAWDDFTLIKYVRVNAQIWERVARDLGPVQVQRDELNDEWVTTFMGIPVRSSHRYYGEAIEVVTDD